MGENKVAEYNLSVDDLGELSEAASKEIGIEVRREITNAVKKAQLEQDKSMGGR